MVNEMMLMPMFFLQNGDLHVTVGHTHSRTSTLEIPQATVEGSRNNRRRKPVAGRLAVATVVSSKLVEDATIRLSGFDLHRRHWSLLNRFRTGQDHCNA